MRRHGRRFSIFLGDARDILPTLPPSSIDAVITDPPYNNGPKSRFVSKGAHYAEVLPELANNHLPQEQWRELLLAIFKECYRLLKRGGVLITWIDWRHLNVMAEFLKETHLPAKGVIVWDKTKAARPVKGGFRLQTEFLLWTREPGGSRPAVFLDGVFRVTTRQCQKKHPTEKPIALVESLLPIVPTGGTILDPFMGSGTTGIAALKHGYYFYGVEIVPQYFEIAFRRLQDAESHP